MKYFGTDGIRGVAGDSLPAKLAFDSGYAVGKVMKKEANNFIIGRDTRLSGDMVSACVCAGLSMAGCNVVDVGIIPTAGVAYLTKRSFADAGIVISASHNPPEYNGIKVFLPNGQKLDDETQAKIEEEIDYLQNDGFCSYDLKMGKIVHDDNIYSEYVDFLVNSIDVDLKNMVVALDVCYGASYKIAPMVFEQLGAKVVAEHGSNDGEFINVNCGATNTTRLCGEVSRGNFDFGFAFDGDSDRCFAVDENGAEVDGDKILYLLAKDYIVKNKLNKNTVVGTICSTWGLEKALKEMGVSLQRVDVGDENIIRSMLLNDYSLGGEQSGHIILKDLLNTGDGILTAVIVAGIVKKSGKKLSQLVEEFQDFPVFSKSLKATKEQKKRILNNKNFNAFIKNYKEQHSELYVVTRPSGTEDKFKITVQGYSKDVVEKSVYEIEQEVLAALEEK